jgi:anti-sigma factor RsiW
MSDVVCRTGVEHLMDYLEDTLPASLRSELEQHVAGCAKCVAFIASYQAAPRIVREATHVDLPASAGRALLQFLRRQREP